MTYSAARLTCFALISSLEEDLRRTIEDSLDDKAPDELFTPDELEKISERRRRDRGANETQSTAALLPYLDFGDSLQIIQRMNDRLDQELKQQLRSAGPRFERLLPVRNRVAHTRPMEIGDLPNTLDLCRELCAGSHAKSWPNTADTISRISRDPSYVLGLSVNLPSDPDTAPYHNLPVPDFDETGFFGRKRQVDRIKKIIKGAYPVVSILGDGGIGKTAIALRVAYDILDDPRADFDAVVWVTAKAERLTTNEVQRINGAIEDSLGLFTEAAETLGGTNSRGPFLELLDYLEHFKVLLILDNLETVLDERLREFLLEIPLGSKVIVTSRIGLGIENPVNLGPLDEDESERLFHALARVREITVFDRLGREQMTKILQVMGGRPAYIKWFVSGVQAGQRPEDLLQQNELFLDFCMSNVYRYLGEDARTVLRCLQILPGPRTQAEIAFITEFNAELTQTTILELLTTNFVQMRAQSEANGIGSSYELTEFGRSYLEKQHPVSSGQRLTFQERYRELTDLGKTLRAENAASPYDPVTLNVSNPGEFSAARLLREAIRLAQARKYDQALEMCAEAKRLAPTYFETHRIAALIYTWRGDNYSARNSYELALELADDYPPLNYFYGKFLLDEGVDVEGALAALRKSARKDQEKGTILSQIAWANLLLRRYEDTIETAQHILGLNITSSDGGVALTLALRAAIYQVRNLISDRFIDRPVEILEDAIELCERCNHDFLTGEGIDRLLQIADIADEFKAQVEEDFLVKKLVEFRHRAVECARRVDPGSTERRVGTVITKKEDKYFGFATWNRRNYFFHLRDLDHESDWDHISAGGLVAFRPDNQAVRGPRGESVRWID